MPPTTPLPFAVYLAAGDGDFNFPELQELDGTLERLQTPHEFEAFSGGHEWPPEAVCTHSMEWLELQAMKSGIRAKDPSLIERIYAKTIREAESYEKNKQLLQSTERYVFALRSFAGLRDIAELDSQIARLRQAEPVRRARSLEKDVETRQRIADRELMGFFQDLSAGKDRQFAAQKLHAELDRLRNDSSQRGNEIRRLAATRSLTYFWIMLNEETTAALEQREYGRAALRLELMARVRLDNPQIDYHLARAYSMTGKKKEAIKSLQNAVAKGFKDVAVLESNRDLEPLRRMPEYQEIIDNLRRH